MSAPRTGLLGKKLGMTQVFTPAGDLKAVTAIAIGNNLVVGKRTVEKDGYAAVRIGFGERKLKNVPKPELGVFTKAGVAPTRFVRELRLGDAELGKYEVGKAVPVETIFRANTYVDVVATSKGKGYQGVMKKHKMGGNRATHGTHEFFRHGGSIGCRLTPGRVHKGKRMSAHMGDVRKTVQNIAVVDVLAEQQILLIHGAVPGPKNGFVLVKNATKKVGEVKARTGEVQEKSKNPMKASKAGAASAKKK